MAGYGRLVYGRERLGWRSRSHSDRIFKSATELVPYSTTVYLNSIWWHRGHFELAIEAATCNKIAIK